jgi:hypothetical protein
VMYAVPSAIPAISVIATNATTTTIKRSQDPRPRP